MSYYILSLDQGTTSSRAIIFNKKGKIIEIAQQPLRPIYPQLSWIEHDPKEIWSTQASSAVTAIAKAGINGKNIAAIGITNQRESIVVWERSTGVPIYNAIVWQDRRTSEFCNKLKLDGLGPMIQEKTGLVVDAYFSASKIKWILDHVQGAREKAIQGKLCCGTIDSWLMAKFTNFKVHLTDITNASRTMLYNIHSQEWDDDLLNLFTIPKNMLPEVKESSEIFSNTSTTLFATKIPISGVAGDQHSALFGQMCINPGMLKTTYGTGCFMMMNTGDNPASSKQNLLTTVAWKINGKITYALEGSVFMGGAIIQWLRDELKLIDNLSDSEKLSQSVKDNGGVYLVPAMTGLGAPYWDQFARGSILGLTRGSSKEHIVRAALESIVYQVTDIAQAQMEDTNMKITEMRVDGAAVSNNFLIQFQSNMMNSKVIRPKILETTALGVAFFAGLTIGYWDGIDQIKTLWEIDKEFKSELDDHVRKKYLLNWHKAVDRSKGWAN